MKKLLKISIILGLIVVMYSCEKDKDDGPKNYTITDSRDGKEYDIVKIGNQHWFAENLAFLPEVCDDDGDCGYWVYDFFDTSVEDAKNTEMYKKYGVLYSFETANTSCPEGWHLPSDDEWKELEITIGINPNDVDNDGWRGSNEGNQLKATIGWGGEGTDEYGFNGLEGGRRDNYGAYSYGGESAFFWSSTDYYDKNAWSRELLDFDNSIHRYDYSIEFGFSVRCVKN